LLQRRALQFIHHNYRKTEMNNVAYRTMNNYLDGNAGYVWGQLQAERAGVSRALLEEARPVTSNLAVNEASDESTRDVEFRHCESMQVRLHQIDDALDRLLSGSYGRCSDCGGPIAAERLRADPAVLLCVACQSSLEDRTSFSSL
jgi:RNA polymerase-binding transcription factor